MTDKGLDQYKRDAENSFRPLCQIYYSVNVSVSNVGFFTILVLSDPTYRSQILLT